MIIYIDAEFKCHITNDGTMTAIETDFFDGKCKEYIEGYRYVTSGSVWVREDGVEFHGEMIAPWKDYEELAYAQLLYENAALTAENKTQTAQITALTDELANIVYGVYINNANQQREAASS